MNKGVIFTLGLVTGGSLVGLATALYFKYSKRENKSGGGETHSQTKFTFSNDDIPEMYRRKSSEEPVPKMSKDEKDKIREKLSMNNERTTAYATMYKSHNAENIMKATNIFDAVSESDEAESEEEEVTVEVMDRDGREPRIVKESVVDDCPEGWDVEQLYLYRDGTLTDEDDAIFEESDKEKMFGEGPKNCLTKYDFINSDEKVIYVQNFRLHTFYEITKYDKDFEQ